MFNNQDPETMLGFVLKAFGAIFAGAIILQLIFWIFMSIILGVIAYKGYKLLTTGSTPTQQKAGIGMMVFAGIIFAALIFWPDDDDTDKESHSPVTHYRQYSYTYAQTDDEGGGASDDQDVLCGNKTEEECERYKDKLLELLNRQCNDTKSCAERKRRIKQHIDQGWQ
jgi:hypothetical protein